MNGKQESKSTFLFTIIFPFQGLTSCTYKKRGFSSPPTICQAFSLSIKSQNLKSELLKSSRPKTANCSRRSNRRHLQPHFLPRP